MKEFLTFLKTGKAEVKNRFINDYVFLFLIVFAIKFSISFLKGYFLDMNMIEEKDFEKLSLKTIISYVLIIPFIEETIFRATLIIPRNKGYSIIISIIVSLLTLFFLKNTLLILIIIITIGLVQIGYLTSRKVFSFVNILIKRNYLLLVYLTSIIFGLLHMWNYDTIGFLSFISVIGTIISGFYYAFITTKYNFISSCILHSINNIIPFLILIIAK